MKLRLILSAVLLATLSCGGGDITGPPSGGGGGGGGGTPTTATIALAPDTATLTAGQTRQLTATAKDASGAALTRTFTWTSSAPAVATVNNGLVTAVAAGTASITASVDGKTSPAATVTVLAGTVMGSAGGTIISEDTRARLAIPAGALATTTLVSVSPTTSVPASSYAVGSAYRFTPDTLTLGTAGQLTLSWTTLPQGATATSLKIYTVVAGEWVPVAGTVDTTAKTVTAPVTKLGTYALLWQAPVSSVVITPGAPGVTVGSSIALKAVLRTSAGDTVFRTVQWTSSDTTKAKITAGGTVTGVAAGTATVTATSEGKSATATVTVSAGTPVGTNGGTVWSRDSLAKIVIQPNALTGTVSVAVDTARTAPASEYTVGAAYEFAPTGTALASATGAQIYITYPAPPAGVDPITLRLYRLENGGWVQVTATWNNNTATRTMTAQVGTLGTFAVMWKAPLGQLSISPAAISVPVGGYVAAKAVYRDVNGDTLTAARTAAWTSSDTTKVKVHPTGGTVTGIATGTATITLSVEGKTATASVTVTDAPPVPVGSITIEGSGNMVVGGTSQFAATVRDTTGQPIAGRTVIWASSDVTVASVSASGVVTAVKVGTATISASADGKAGQLLVTVVAAASQATLTWVGGDVGGASNWSNAQNWLEKRLPAATDTVVIPASAATQPVMTVGDTIAALRVEQGARLDISTYILHVGVRADALGTITGSGNGLVSVGGVNTPGTIIRTVRGTFPSLRTIGTTRAIANTTVNGAFQASTGFDVNGYTLRVNGDATGPFVMKSAGSEVIATGVVNISGGQDLVTGVIRASGTSVTVNGATAGYGTLSLVLDGAATIVNGTVQELDIASTSDVEANVTVHGAVVVRNPITIRGTVLKAGRSLTAPASSTISTTLVTIGDVLNTAGRFSPDSVTFAGTGGANQPIPTGTNYIYKTVAVLNSARLTGPTTLAGNLWTTSAGLLDVANFSLTATGNLNGNLQMVNAGESVTILGHVAVGGTLTAGTLYVGGDITRHVGASGTHRTIMNGIVKQVIRVPATGMVFQELDLENTNGVDLPAGAIDVKGTLTAAQGVPLTMTNALITAGRDIRVVDAARITGTGGLDVARDLTVGTSGTVNVTNVWVTGALTSAGSYRASATHFRGGTTAAPQQINGGPAYTYINVFTSGQAAAFASDVAIAANLTATNGTLDINGKAVQVAGSFQADTALLRLRTATGDLTVKGDFLVQHYAGAVGAEQSAGTVRVGGNFTGNAGWEPTGTNVVILTGRANGLATQSLNASFQELFVRGRDSVYTGYANVRGNFTVDSAAVVYGGRFARLLVAGDITGTPAASKLVDRIYQTYLGLQPDTGYAVSVGGKLAWAGPWSPDTTRFIGAVQDIPGAANYEYKSMVIAGQEGRFAGPASIRDRLTIAQTAIATLNGRRVTAGKSVYAHGTLRMQAAGDSLLTKLITFEGTPVRTGEQTDGYIQVDSVFIGGAAWAPSGTHRAQVAGILRDSVRFHHLTLVNQPAHVVNRRGLVVSQNLQGTQTGAAILVGGDVQIQSDSLFGGVMRVTGSVTAAATNGTSLTELSVGGVLTATARMKPVTTIFTGANQSIPTGPTYTNITVTGPSVAFGANLTFPGVLTIAAGGVLDMNGKTVTGGSLFAQGLLKMLLAADLLRVGEVDFSGTAPAAGQQIAGTLEVRGDFSATGEGAPSFAPSGTHKTVFTAGGTQAVRTSGASFNEVVTNNVNGVTLNSTTINKSLDVSNRLIIPAGSTVRVVQNITLRAGSQLVNNQGGVITYGGTLSNSGSVVGTAPVKQ